MICNKRSWWLLAVLILFQAGLICCQKVASVEKKAIKLLPLLTAKNIDLSPFPSQVMGKEKEFIPLESSPLEAQEAGPNPFGLKRRLHIGPNYIAILFAPAESRYSFDVNIPPNSCLEFGAGIIRDKNFAQIQKKLGLKPEGVEFLVRLQQGKHRRIIFQKFLAMPEERESRTLIFRSQRVDLPADGGPFRLIFETKSGHGSFAFWSSPIIFPHKETPKGIILISLDTLRADHLSCYGYGRPTSPAIDSLASDGALFLQAISTSSWTLPAHVSLLTSADPPRHGVMAVDNMMPTSLTTLAEILSRNGFFCGAITGGGFLSSQYGFVRGFDFYNEAEGSVDFINSAELVFKAARSWLEDNKDKDFFLFLHTYQIHSPYASPLPYRQTFLSSPAKFEEINMERYLGGKGSIFRPLSPEERNNAIDLYDGEIKYTDEVLIGNLIGFLKEKNLYDRMMIVLTSDHGEEFYEHGAWVHGAHLYQESIRVPLIIKFPQGQFKGIKADQIVRLTDIAPTIFEAVGLGKRIPKTWDGRSLWPILRGKEAGDRTFLADTCWLSGEVCGDDRTGFLPLSVATNRGKQKMIFNRHWPDSLRQLYYPEPKTWQNIEIYDLEKDLGEGLDLSLSQSIEINDILQSIQARYSLLRKMSRPKMALSPEELEKLRALGYIH